MGQKTKKSVVILGGGHGGSVVLASLKKYDFDLSAVVSMADNGGSTGRLRTQLGVLPPGDIRQYLVADSDNEILKKLFSYRFENGDLKGHSFGNLFLSAGEAMTGNLEDSIKIAREVLGGKAKVFPATKEKIELVLAQNGKIVRGEEAIYSTVIEVDQPELYLEPAGSLADSARQAIENADLVIIAPGNLYCSILPDLIVDGMAEALTQTKAKIAYICNLVNMPQHTKGFTVESYVKEIERLTSKDLLDYVIFNTAPINSEYLREGEEAVTMAGDTGLSYQAIGIEIVGQEQVVHNNNDAIANNRALLAHDKEKLGEVIARLVSDF